MTPEQKQQLNEVTKRHNQQPPSTSTMTCWKDVDFLLSLVSQEAAGCQDYNCMTTIADETLWCATCAARAEYLRGKSDAATSMRARCVEKIKWKAVDWQRYEMHAREDPLRAQLFYKYEAALELIKHLESVSIQEQQK